MASFKQVLVVAAVACLASISMASATVWMVGDDLGWRAKFNQTGWADGKTFVVGDSLLFMYPKDNHTVVQVGKDDFAKCNLQGNLIAGPWISGNDTVLLDNPGKIWFICTKPNHCNGGMKLVIDVVDGTTAPAPSPLPFTFPFPPRAPSPLFRGPFPTFPLGSAPAAPPSAATRYPVGGAVAVAAAVLVAAALAF